MTPKEIISLSIDPFVFNGDATALIIIDALAAYGYDIVRVRVVSEVCRDGEMKVM